MNSLIITCPSCGKKNRISAAKQHLQPRCGHCQSQISMANQGVVVELGDNDFHDFIKQASLPVMVDFYSPTCGPCQMMTPVVSGMAREHLNKFIIAKVNTSVNQRIASFFNIRGVPSFLFFKGGNLVDQITGAVDGNVLALKLKSL